MVTASKKEEHPKEGKKSAEKKAELVPIEKLLDALHEGIVTTLTEVPKHMDVFGDGKAKIEEVLKESIRVEEMLRKLPRKKTTGPGTKVKPNEEEIKKIREVIAKFVPYVQQMHTMGESFRADFSNLKEMEEGQKKTEAALLLANGMVRSFAEIKGVNTGVQTILKNEQYVFVPETEQNVFEDALVVFFSEFIAFTYIINYALRYSVTKEEDKKAVDSIRKSVLDELKAIADVSEKNHERFKRREADILKQIKDAKELEQRINEEEKAELERFKLLQKDAEPIIKAIKDEIKRLIDEIKKQDSAFAAFGELEKITVKELKELKEIPAKISAEIGKIKIAAEEIKTLQSTIPPSGIDAIKQKTKKIQTLEETIEASKKEIKKQLDAFKEGVNMEKTMGRREVLSLNTVVNTTQEIITSAAQIEDILKDKLLVFLQSEAGKKAFAGDKINNATTAALGEINELQTIIIEEQEERSMIGTVGRIMKDREQKEQILRQEVERLKKEDALFKDNNNFLMQMPKIVNTLNAEIEQIASAEQALINALATSKETANKIKTQVADVQIALKGVEELLPEKGFFANVFKRFRR